jgi:hypothetical protein
VIARRSLSASDLHRPGAWRRVDEGADERDAEKSATPHRRGLLAAGATWYA